MIKRNNYDILVWIASALVLAGIGLTVSKLWQSFLDGFIDDPVASGACGTPRELTVKEITLPFMENLEFQNVWQYHDYLFSLDTGDVLITRAVTIHGLTDPIICIYSSTGEMLVSDDDSLTNKGSLIIYPVIIPDLYRVRVTVFSRGGVRVEIGIP